MDKLYKFQFLKIIKMDKNCIFFKILNVIHLSTIYFNKFVYNKMKLKLIIYKFIILFVFK